MVTALTGIEMSQELLQLINPYLLMVLVPFKHSLSYIYHIQYSSVFTFPSSFVLFNELTIPRDGFTYSFVDYKSVLDRSGGYHVWHHPEIIMS